MENRCQTSIDDFAFSSVAYFVFFLFLLALVFAARAAVFPVPVFAVRVSHALVFDALLSLVHVAAAPVQVFVVPVVGSVVPVVLVPVVVVLQF